MGCFTCKWRVIGSLTHTTYSRIIFRVRDIYTLCMVRRQHETFSIYWTPVKCGWYSDISTCSSNGTSRSALRIINCNVLWMINCILKSKKLEGNSAQLIIGSNFVSKNLNLFRTERSEMFFLSTHEQGLILTNKNDNFNMAKVWFLF